MRNVDAVVKADGAPCDEGVLVGMAVPQYNAVTQFEPTNVEALFDEGQVYGALKMTRAALTWYSNTLNVDPTHRDAAVASERASAEISPNPMPSTTARAKAGKARLSVRGTVRRSTSRTGSLLTSVNTG